MSPSSSAMTMGIQRHSGVFRGRFRAVIDKLAKKKEVGDSSRKIKFSFSPSKPNTLLQRQLINKIYQPWYFDVPAIVDYLDFVNLAAFDFLTPLRNPEEADFTAPLYALNTETRLPYFNVDFQVDFWLSNKCPSNKINVGVATYGRAWKMTTDSGVVGEPIVSNTDGVAHAGLQSQIPGILSWPEVCGKLPNPTNAYLKGAEAPLRRISDPTKRYGPYAYRPADANNEHGMWVSYEDPDSAANKAIYVRAKNLGGLALFDLSYDDFRGLCTGDKYPILRAAKYRL